MTGMDLGSLLSDLVAAKKKMREKKGSQLAILTSGNIAKNYYKVFLSFLATQTRC